MLRCLFLYLSRRVISRLRSCVVGPLPGTDGNGSGEGNGTASRAFTCPAGARGDSKGYHLLIQRQKRLTFDHPELDIDSLLRLKCANRSLGFRAVVALVTSSQSEAERMGSIRETPQGLELGIAKRSLR